ncbi:hypothetical protein OSB04_028273 [Centaurea solstitialis]|uniref:Uncharacterized protein n=1 Tax=Centaurea solstitialis TaxID=347529 RepID=A0AA38SYY3_9ASTR|nr:hypothetical protein OSB04_028273 [Centaurea solstitialis]
MEAVGFSSLYILIESTGGTKRTKSSKGQAKEGKKKKLKEWRKNVWGEIDKKVKIAKDEAKNWEAKSGVSLLDDLDRSKWIESRKKRG